MTDTRTPAAAMPISEDGDLLLVYQKGYADGKKHAAAMPEQDALDFPTTMHGWLEMAAQACDELAIANRDRVNCLKPHVLEMVAMELRHYKSQPQPVTDEQKAAASKAFESALKYAIEVRYSRSTTAMRMDIDSRQIETIRRALSAPDERLHMAVDALNTYKKHALSIINGAKEKHEADKNSEYRMAACDYAHLWFNESSRVLKALETLEAIQKGNSDE